jgi:hypothetical protein
MAAFEAKMTGDKQVRRELRRLSRRAPRAVGHALFDEAAQIFVESQEEVVVDTGRLRGSGLVRARERTMEIEVIVSYGTQYALRIHEDGGLEQRRRARGTTHGKWKYLQEPFERNVPGIVGRIATRAKMHLKAGEQSPVSSRKMRGK